MKKKTKDKVETLWEVWHYDVWGNARDGFEVNNRFNIHRAYPLAIEVWEYNCDTEHRFNGAYPTDKQIKAALDLNPRIKIEVDGDDLSIYVTHGPTGEPLGEMYCISHSSLSPVRV